MLNFFNKDDIVNVSQSSSQFFTLTINNKNHDKTQIVTLEKEATTTSFPIKLQIIDLKNKLNIENELTSYSEVLVEILKKV